MVPSTTYHKYWLYTISPGLKEFQSNEKTGKWCIFGDVSEIDNFWSKICDLAKEGKITCAKCSTALTSGWGNYPKYVICVYTNDWTNLNEVMHVRNVLQEAGFTSPLGYKRDIDTRNKVYGENEWMLKI